MNDIYIMESLARSKHIKAEIFDIAILSASADNRAYCGIRNLIKQGIEISQLYVLRFKNQEIDKEDSLFSQYNGYKELGIPFLELIISNDEIMLDADLLLGRNMLIDITGFSIPDLQRLLFITTSILNISKLHMLYTEPEYYVFGNGMFDSYAYLIGEREYRALDEFYISGTDNQEVLVIFLGFDRMTSTVVREAVDPSETVLVNGFPALTPKLKDISLLNNKEIIQLIGKPKYNVKTNNPFSAYNTLQEIQKDHPGTLINVCVLGTKPMALGATIYALQNQNIKLSYAYAREQAHNVSKGESTTWYYQFTINKS